MKRHEKSISSIIAKKSELVAMKAGLEFLMFEGSENGREIAAVNAAIGNLDEQMKKIEEDDRKDSRRFNTFAVCVIFGSIIGIVLVFTVL